MENRPAIRSTRTASSHVPTFEPLRKELNGHDASSARPSVNRATTFEGPTQLYRDASPPQRVSRAPSNTVTVRNQRAQLRPSSRVNPDNDLFSDPSDESTFSSPDRSYKERSASPATSHGSAPPSRSTSYSTLTSAPNGKKQAPPPPPSRAKKPPPPPPPPMKRSALSTTSVSYA